jgi:SPP1 gp7 family putative phage head morphogenesis protein
MSKPSFLSRVANLFKLADSTVQNEQVQKVSLHLDPVGSSGTQNYAGYYQEEYFHNLIGRPAADVYDQMRRSDPKIKMVLSAVKNPIKAACWTVESGDASDESAKRHAELIEHILFNDMDKPWSDTLHEILSMVDFGYSAFEMTHKVVIGNKKFGTYNGIKKLGFRSQRTIERWNLDKETGELVSISQYAYGDLQRLVDIPAEYLMVFTLDKEGDNYEGISGLRPCYGPFIRKKTYLKLMAIGIEKFAVPPPVLTIPIGKENTEEEAIAKQVMRKYLSHEQQFITKPDGWDIDFVESHFDAEKVITAIQFENTEIVHAFLANFLELGQSGGGSYALSFDLSDFFLGGIEHVAKIICEVINQSLIPDLVKMNFGPQETYPKLTCSGISDKVGKEFAEIIKLLMDGRALTPDQDLEANLRKRFNLPEKKELPTLAPEAPNNTPVTPNIPDLKVVQQPTVPAALSEKVIQLADKPKTPKAMITDGTDELKSIMITSLTAIGKDLAKQLMSKYKSATPSQYADLIKKVNPKGMNDYQNSIQSFLATQATQSIAMARKEVPKAKGVKLSEYVTSMKLSEFDQLPPDIQKRIKAQSGLLAETQLADLEKAVYFRFSSSVQSTDSASLIESDLNEIIDDFVGGASVAASAGNSVALIVNESRNAFFMDEEVEAEIESFTFVNADPVSPICQDLNGTVFSKDDPNFDRYSPPLHHNCKSFLVPNLNGTKKEITPGGLKPSKSELEDYITLSEEV